jgi:hypothetical protein
VAVFPVGCQTYVNGGVPDVGVTVTVPSHTLLQLGFVVVILMLIGVGVNVVVACVEHIIVLLTTKLVVNVNVVGFITLFTEVVNDDGVSIVVGGVLDHVFVIDPLNVNGVVRLVGGGT